MVFPDCFGGPQGVTLRQSVAYSYYLAFTIVPNPFSVLLPQLIETTSLPLLKPKPLPLFSLKCHHCQWIHCFCTIRQLQYSSRRLLVCSIGIFMYPIIHDLSKYSCIISLIWWDECFYCVGNRSKRGKCGSAPTRKSQWGVRLAGRTHVHG